MLISCFMIFVPANRQNIYECIIYISKIMLGYESIKFLLTISDLK